MSYNLDQTRFEVISGSDGSHVKNKETGETVASYKPGTGIKITQGLYRGEPRLYVQSFVSDGIFVRSGACFWLD